MRQETQNHTYSTADGLKDRYGDALETLGECAQEMNELLSDLRMSRRAHISAEKAASAAYENVIKKVEAIDAAIQSGDDGDWQSARRILLSVLSNNASQQRAD